MGGGVWVWVWEWVCGSGLVGLVLGAEGPFPCGLLRGDGGERAGTGVSC